MNCFPFDLLVEKFKTGLQLVFGPIVNLAMIKEILGLSFVTFLSSAQ